jgi:aldehyde dehydrogenase
MTVYAQPGQAGAKVEFKARYENWIGGKWVPPTTGKYFENVTPITGKQFTEAAQGTAADIELALDAAHKAAPAWGKTSAADRALILHRIGDRMMENLEMLAVAETWDNGKAIRETLNADIPLSADHFRYFAGAIRAQEGGVSQIDDDTTAFHFHEPLGVVGQIIPWNFPILMAVWKLAPALAAGNCVILKPASLTPTSIMVLAELIGDLLPPGVLNVVTGPGSDAGKALASSKRIRKIAFTGETTTGRQIAEYASKNLIPATLYAFNSGEVCTCPSRALVQDSFYDSFMADAVARTENIILGNPLDTNTQMGAQVSKGQMETILGYIEIGKKEGAKVLTGGARVILDGDLADGYYIKPTILAGTNDMRVFQEEIFGPVLAVARFTDYDDAISIANDTVFGLGAGVWSRNGNLTYRAGRDIQAGRVWVNNYHAYPAHSAFGGYKDSGIGRETHLMVLEHYQQTKNLLVSYSENKLGFF